MSDVSEKWKVKSGDLCKTKKDTANKNSRTNLELQFQENPLTKQRTRPRLDNKTIGKTIYEKIEKKVKFLFKQQFLTLL